MQQKNKKKSVFKEMISAIVSAVVFCLRVRQRNAYATERRYTLKPSHPASHSAAGPAAKRYTTLHPSHSAAGPAPPTVTNAARVLGDTALRGQVASYLGKLSERKDLYDAMGRDARGTMSGTDTALFLTDKALDVGACPDENHLLRSTLLMKQAVFKWEALRKAVQKETDADEDIIDTAMAEIENGTFDIEWTSGLNLSALRYFQCFFANNNDKEDANDNNDNDKSKVKTVEQAANDVRKVFDLYVRMLEVSVALRPMKGVPDAEELTQYVKFLALPFERDGRARGFSPATLAAIQALRNSVQAAHAATLRVAADIQAQVQAEVQLKLAMEEQGC